MPERVRSEHRGSPEHPAVSRSTTLIGGMLLHLQRHPASPLVAAERCTDSQRTLAALRHKSATADLPRSPVEAWLGQRVGPRNQSFTAFEDALTWEDVEPLCDTPASRGLLPQLQAGAEPFGAISWPPLLFRIPVVAFRRCLTGAMCVGQVTAYFEHVFVCTACMCSVIGQKV